MPEMQVSLAQRLGCDGSNCEPLKAASAMPRFHKDHMPPVKWTGDGQYDLKHSRGLGKDRTSDRW